MRKNKSAWRYYRRLRTAGEQRANCEIREDGERIKWGRSCRNSKILDPWTNEKNHIVQKTWKASRKTQYRPGGRGKKYTITISAEGRSWTKRWNFEEYCSAQSIPFKIRRLSHLEYYWQYREPKWCIIDYKEESLYSRDYRTNIIIERKFYRPVYGYKYIPLDKPIRRCSSVTDGYELSWWTNKNIDMQSVINKAV